MGTSFYIHVTHNVLGTQHREAKFSKVCPQTWKLSQSIVEPRGAGHLSDALSKFTMGPLRFILPELFFCAMSTRKMARPSKMEFLGSVVEQFIKSLKFSLFLCLGTGLATTIIWRIFLHIHNNSFPYNCDTFILTVKKIYFFFFPTLGTLLL